MTSETTSPQKHQKVIILQIPVHILQKNIRTAILGFDFICMIRFSTVGSIVWVLVWLWAGVQKASAQCSPLLAGTYTVGQPQAFFPRLEQALEALRCGGSTGPIQLQLLPGNYDGNYILDSLPGAIQHALVLRGGPDVVFNRPPEALIPGSIQLRGGRWRLEQLVFVRNSLARTAAPLMRIAGARQVVLVNNRFVSEVNDQRTQALAVEARGTDSLRIDSNTFEGWHRGLHLEQGTGLGFAHNLVSNYTGTFFEAQQWQGLNIHANRLVEARRLLPVLQAFYLREVSALQFWANRITGNLPQHVLRLERPVQMVGTENRVFNNEVNGTWQLAGNNSAALFWFDAQPGSQNLEVFALHNSFRLQVDREMPGASILRLTGWRLPTDSVLFANNLLAVELTQGQLSGWPHLVSTDTLRSPGVGLRSNAYAHPDSTQAFWVASTASSLSWTQWRSQTGFDLVGAWANPLWRNPASNLLPSQLAFNGIGAALAWPATDITGFPRNAAPDPGAYEFDILQRELRLSDLEISANTCQQQQRRRASAVLSNLGTESFANVPVKLWQQGVLVGHLRIAQLQQGASIRFFFPDSLTINSAQPIELVAFIDSLADPLAINDTAKLLLPPTIPTFPRRYSFNDLALGSTLVTSSWVQRQGSHWFLEVNNPASIAPVSADAGGVDNGRFLWLQPKTTVPVTVTDTVELQWECVNLQSLLSPELSFQVHKSSTAARLMLWQRIGATWQLIDSVVPNASTALTHEWQHRRFLLAAQAEALRLQWIVPANSPVSWGIDDLQLAEANAEDLQLDSVQIVLPTCQNTGEILITAFLRNSTFGVVFPMAAGAQLVGANAVTTLANRALLNFSRDTLQLRVPFSSPGSYTLRVFCSNVRDLLFVNDTLHIPIVIRGTVSQYPYTDDFETATAWSAAGLQSSWQRARPQANRLNAAGSGQWAWVTAPRGQPNAGERSWVQSPCLNLDGLLRPRLEFLLWYDLGSAGRAWVEYEAAPGIWATLGAAFSGNQWYNAPGTQPAWRGSSNGWLAVSHDLDPLLALSSTSIRIVYQAPSDSFLQAQPIEGIAIDRVRIVESAGSFVSNLQAAGENCTPISRQLTATVARANQLQQIDLLYRVDGGPEQALPMAPSGANYVATIPAQAAGARVSYRVQTLSDTLLSTPVRWYTDGFFGQQLPDVSGPSRLPVTLDAGVSAGGDLSLATGASDTAAAAWLEVEALRYTEIEGVWVQPTAFTSVRVFGQIASSSGDSLRFDQLAPLGSVDGIGPGGSFYILFNSRPAMRPGQKLILYVESAVSNALRISKSALPVVTQDASIAVRPGRWFAQARTNSAGPGLPVMRVVSRNPAQNVRWTNMQGQPLSNQPLFSRNIGLSADSVVLRLERSNCTYFDTVALLPTGQFDLAVTQILAPQLAQVQLGVFYPVTVVVANRGNLEVSEAELAYRVNGAVLAVSPLNRSIAPNDTIHFTFPQLWTWVEGNSILMCAYPRDFSLDVLRNNDTTCVARFPTSVDEGASMSVRLYPQPASEQVILELSAPVRGTMVWQLYDAMGRQVRSQLLTDAAQRFVLPLGDLPSGLYHYQLYGDRLLDSGKLLVRR